MKEDPETVNQERAGLGDTDLVADNIRHADSGGVSAGNRRAGFVPAFMDRSSGETVVSCYADGQPAPVHVLDGLPEHWVRSRERDGRVRCARPSVVAGFLRDGVFYTREAAASAMGREAR